MNKRLDKMIQRTRKLIVLMLIVLLVLMLAFTILECATAESFNEFENINLTEELESIEGFKWNDYPFDSSSDSIEIFNVLEYRYSYYSQLNGDYGLYIYIYNKANKFIDKHSNQNTIMLATAFNEKGEPTNYEKFKLRFISTITFGTHVNKFYKFKVVERYSEEKLVDIVNRDCRQYCISEIELAIDNKPNASKLNVAATYKYTGFLEGLGNSTENTLNCTVNHLDTIIVDGEDFGHTSYTFEANNEHGIGYHNQISSVYFSIPNKYLINDGKLQKVKFEAYRYETAPIFVTSTAEYYVKIGDHRYHIYDDYCFGKEILVANYGYTQPGLGVLCAGDIAYGNYNNDDIILNRDPREFNSWKRDTVLYVNKLPYIFYSDFPLDNRKKFVEAVSSRELLEYIYKYSVCSNDSALPIKSKQIASSLFMPPEGDPFIQKEIDAGDNYSLKNVTIDKGWGIFGKLFPKKPEERFLEVEPIKEVVGNIYQNDLYVHSNDVTEFKDKLKIATNKNRTMHMFRFAMDDYYSSYVYSLKGFPTFINSYMSQTTAYLDFDLIQLTFNKEGKMKVVPVAMAPVDIVSGITSPSEDVPLSIKDIFDALKRNLKIIIIVFCVILLVALLLPVIRLIISFFKGNGKNKVKVIVEGNGTVVSAKEQKKNNKARKKAVSKKQRRLRKKE